MRTSFALRVISSGCEIHWRMRCLKASSLSGLTRNRTLFLLSRNQRNRFSHPIAPEQLGGAHETDGMCASTCARGAGFCAAAEPSPDRHAANSRTGCAIVRGFNCSRSPTTHLRWLEFGIGTCGRQRKRKNRRSRDRINGQCRQRKTARSRSPDSAIVCRRSADRGQDQSH